MTNFTLFCLKNKVILMKGDDFYIYYSLNSFSVIKAEDIEIFFDFDIII